MTSIHVLPTEIINQIAAGEVVERPAHLVKELVENSLDAGADQITVDVSSGGRSIRVLDNGGGISSEDLPQALQRHATSKINKTDDLWNLRTFGFRGEALASAAAVSKLILKSSEKHTEVASQIESVFGQVSDVKPLSKMLGTEIVIQDLFENVPARLKFLKSDSTEIQQIKTVIKALALSYHQTEFKLICDGSLQLFFAKKKTRLERAQDVLEKKILFETETNADPYRCHVVFSSPQDVAKSSRQIWIFAQNRWIQDRAIQAAIMDAYRSLLMHGEYPHVALWLDCDPAEIDVNIHPTKSQVKFQDSSRIFRLVQQTLRQALEKAPWMLQANLSSQSENRGSVYSQRAASSPNLKFNDHQLETTQYKNKNFTFQQLESLKVTSHDLGFGLAEIPSVSELSSARELFTNLPKDSSSAFLWSSLQVIGQAHLTYIVCQKADRIVYVDQHAAHERVVFESLMASWKNKKFEVQDFLFPIALDLTRDQMEVLIDAQDGIKELGFEIEALGPEVLGVKAAPALIKDSSLPQVFHQLANELLNHGGSFALEKKMSDLFATMACHSVVRAGQSLSVAEMQELLKSMDQFPLSSFCPHGRPVSVEVTFTELEKQFGRIN